MVLFHQRCPGQDGSVWFGAYWEGALRYVDGSWNVISGQNGLVHYNVNDIYADPCRGSVVCHQRRCIPLDTLKPNEFHQHVGAHKPALRLLLLILGAVWIWISRLPADNGM